MRRIVERIESATQWGIVEEQRQRCGDDGQPLFDAGTGLPKTERLTVLWLREVTPAGMRQTEIPFDDAGREQIVRSLTGGIIVAPANGSPTV